METIILYAIDKNGYYWIIDDGIAKPLLNDDGNQIKMDNGNNNQNTKV